ncbi:MAG: 30S ribosomal protein S20 [Candidatus Omnitrophica bacterium]|nr:30S ribosomal protein S20 [Candidatus Omnitrophota bacterium]
MPNIKSAAKRIRSDAKKRDRNQAILSQLKTVSKKLLTYANDPQKAQEYAKTVIASYDRAVNSKAIPKGRANRRKSRIAAFLKKIGATSSGTSTKKAKKKAVKKEA